MTILNPHHCKRATGNGYSLMFEHTYIPSVFRSSPVSVHLYRRSDPEAPKRKNSSSGCRIRLTPLSFSAIKDSLQKQKSS